MPSKHDKENLVKFDVNYLVVTNGINEFSPWWELDTPIQDDEIGKVLKLKKQAGKKGYDPLVPKSRLWHLKRIAHFVINGIDLPIEIFKDCGEDLVADGFHRLHAARYRKDDFILAKIIEDF